MISSHLRASIPQFNTNVQEDGDSSSITIILHVWLTIQNDANYMVEDMLFLAIGKGQDRT